MHRLFVALRPPRMLRETLIASLGGIDGARWQVDEQLHLTLRFIGEVDRPQAEDIAVALDRVRGPVPTLMLDGTGTFERRGRSHTIWAGIVRDEALLTLRQRIERALVTAGVAADTRAFHPHITLARLNVPSDAVRPFLARQAGLASEPLKIDAFLLYESILGQDGATYTVAARYPLS